VNWLNQLSTLSARDLLALSVVGAVVTAAATLTSTVLKDYLLVRAFESWKGRRELRRVFAKYRDPIVLASSELYWRLNEVVFRENVDFLDESLLRADPEAPERNDTSDLYYRKHKLVSTVYRLCAWLAWLELYRKEVTFLESGRTLRNRAFESLVEALRADLADGTLNGDPLWQSWTDALLFREEQRAIADAVLVNGKDVEGFGGFCALFPPSAKDPRGRWIARAVKFVLNLDFMSDTKDFRRARCLRILWHLLALIALLDRSRRPHPRWRARREAKARIKAALSPYKVSRPLWTRWWLGA
jgi:hypothetical protein